MLRTLLALYGQGMGTLPLTGVRVLDLTTVVMGPLATRMLADMGADVIRVEGPEGDIIRDYEPMRSPKMSAFSMNLNRNKRSIVLNAKDDGDRATLDRLIASCDVFVTNMRRAALERLRLDEAGVRAVRSDIVYCVANGYGSDGPRADHAAYDDVIQAASGLASTFEWTNGEPQLIPSIYADKVSGVHIAFAISAALHGRAQTGEGVSLEIPMAETMAAFNLVEHLSGHTFEPPEGSFSYNRIRTPNRKPRKTSDGWIVILPYSEENWRRFWEFGGEPQYFNDPRFATRSSRVEYADDLYGLMGELVATKSTAEWAAFCDTNSVPMSEVIPLEQVPNDPHFAAVGLIQTDEHPTEGSYNYVRDPIRINGETPALRHHAPRLGADTEAVLAELDELDELERR